ncbi:hypothetical protein [uncultured Desulfosarcina sp.]|uniref:hypothetical protein n=1 Tax=uncultured Desulfosarcina sp. TaxID=218289 RepID=UPI0029C858F1|nr:hypothetical protein [uncultured Desulfosarcina sp.]
MQTAVFLAGMPTGRCSFLQPTTKKPGIFVMNGTPPNKKARDQYSHSSITVSDRVVCEDEACIGKVAGPQTKLSAIAEPQAEKRRKRQVTTLSVGGKKTCTDDACIGKK